MSESITIRRTYKYRLYRCDRHDKYLHRQINAAGQIWNHALALQKRYYRLTRKYISLKHLKHHIAYLRMKTHRFPNWKILDAQAVQDVLERLDKAYISFFSGLAKRPPKFKKVKRYASITFKQTSWELIHYNHNQQRSNGKYSRVRSVVKIRNKKYQFIQHRPLFGTIKTITIKRDGLRRLWICFSVIETIPAPIQATTDHAAGFDFGLRTFLTDHTGKTYISPQFYKQALSSIRVVSKRKDKKIKGSNNHRKAARFLTRSHIRIADKRRDYHYKLAHELCDSYDLLIFEDLNIEGMKRLWGRKVSDLGFKKFTIIMAYLAWKRGKVVKTIGRFERTTGLCSSCSHRQKVTLGERTFVCVVCKLTLDRDHNAAINILRAGASAPTG